MLQQTIKSTLRAFGLDISRASSKPPVPNPLVHHRIDVLFDVGASDGKDVLRARSQEAVRRYRGYSAHCGWYTLREPVQAAGPVCRRSVARAYARVRAAGGAIAALCGASAGRPAGPPSSGSQR